MKRTIQIEIETDDSGRYCGDGCQLLRDNNESCKLIKWGYLDYENGKPKRCDACISSEEICKPLSVEELKKVVEKVRWEMSARLFQKGLKSEIDMSFEIAEAIHRAMTNKEGK